MESSFNSIISLAGGNKTNVKSKKLLKFKGTNSTYL